MKHLGVILFFLGWNSKSVCQTQIEKELPSSKSLFQRAIDLHRQGQLDDAMIFYSRVVEKADASIPARLIAVAHANLAAIMLSRSNGENSAVLFVVEKHLQEALKLDPSRHDFKENLKYFRDNTIGQSIGVDNFGDIDDPAAYVRGIT